MRRRTAALPPDASGRHRLVELERGRDELVEQLRLADYQAETASQCLALVRAAHAVDDGTDVFYQEVGVLSLKIEEVQEHVLPRAFMVRGLLRQRLEEVWAVSRLRPDDRLAVQLAEVATGTHEAEPGVWLHRVQEALDAAVASAAGEAASLRAELVVIDDKRLQILQ